VFCYFSKKVTLLGVTLFDEQLYYLYVYLLTKYSVEIDVKRMNQLNRFITNLINSLLAVRKNRIETDAFNGKINLTTLNATKSNKIDLSLPLSLK